MSKVIFELLRSRKRDLQSGWQGYGDWLVNSLRDGLISSPKSPSGS
jgi:hypothetical protein